MEEQNSRPAETKNGGLTSRDYERSRLMAILEGVSARIIFCFTTGAFLTGYLKYIGADDRVCGQIAAIPVLAGVIQFFSPMLLEKLNTRKKWVTLFNMLHRLMLIMLVFVPLLPVSISSRLYIIAGLYFLSHLMVNMVMPATSSLIISLVPQGMRGKYFSIRETYLIFISSSLNVAMGWILDGLKLQDKTYGGYLVMYGVALLAMVMNLISYIKIKEPSFVSVKIEIKFKKLFFMPLKDKGFRKIIFLFFLWGLSINFSSPFFSIYMVSRLQLSYTFITVNGLLFSVCYIIAVRFWGKISDRKTFTYTAMLSMGLLGIAHGSWFFAAIGMPLTNAIIVLLHIISGVAWGGINISLFNIPYEYSPEEGKTVYLGFNSALSGVVGFISSMGASWIVGSMANYKEQFIGIPVTQMQLVFAISGIMTLLSALYIRVIVINKKALSEQRLSIAVDTKECNQQ